MANTSLVAERRNYRVKVVEDAKNIASEYLKSIELDRVIDFGLPEVDDRYHCWRVPLINQERVNIGEVVIDAYSSFILEKRTTQKEVLESRLLGRKPKKFFPSSENHDIPNLSRLRNTIGFGDSEVLLSEMPFASVDLVFTSPPYYNARPEYADYITYEEYLLKMRKIIHQCHRVLNEGRFFVLNISPVLIRRANRTESSKRLAVPFDFHRLFIEEGFDFIDDIIWVKPEGAGWATGRGRRFAADRNPLQYKPVPVTEYVLVYRKRTEKLIDWHIRKHPDQDSVKRSKIQDGYEITNIWKIHPAHHPKHPAVFPVELAEKVIRYYSFLNDVVLDPFAGIGTVGEAACKTGRRFVLFEINPDYLAVMKEALNSWTNLNVASINWLHCEPLQQYQMSLELEGKGTP